MKPIMAALILSLSALSSQAMAEDVSMSPAYVIGGTFELFFMGLSYGTISLSGSDKQVVMAAREDAVIAVSTDGEIMTARLAEAIKIVRAQAPQLMASDLQIASMLTNP